MTVDVYVCNYTTDNTAKAERVFTALEVALKPSHKRFQAIQRGGRETGSPPVPTEPLRRQEHAARLVHDL